MEETLQKAAERILANNVDGLKDLLQDDDLFFFYKVVIQCYGEAMAKWQQERMYSEEDMKLAFETGRNFQLTGENNFSELFEQYKKK